MIEGKYGFYPCDWQTYYKLKIINMAYNKALHNKAIWDRWYRKQPQNRVIRAKLRDSNGRVVGYKISKPLPEPKVCSVFCKKVDNKVEIIDFPIYTDYRKARYPVKAEEACEGLSLRMDIINELFEKVKNDS